MRPPIHVAHGEANAVLAALPSGSVRLVNTSPRYLDLIDYTAAAHAEHRNAWQQAGRESLADYLHEHLVTCAELYRVCADDATVAIEVDDVRLLRQGRLVPLPDLWRQMLEAAGFRIAEKITLVRTLAIGRRSGHFVRYGGKPGYFLPDNVTSDVIVATKGEPQARLRRDAGPGERIDVAWARAYLRNAWSVQPPNRAAPREGHPVPQDESVVRALVTFYSLPGDVVLDPFAGSGTSGRIARRLGRPSVLIEREKPWADALIAMSGAQPIERRRRGALHPSAQLHLALEPAVHVRLQEAFLGRTTRSEVSERIRRIAAVASNLAGVEVPPELAAILLRAERAHCAQQKGLAHV